MRVCRFALVPVLSGCLQERANQHFCLTEGRTEEGTGLTLPMITLSHIEILSAVSKSAAPLNKRWQADYRLELASFWLIFGLRIHITVPNQQHHRIAPS
jgi:hypothetical protein